MGTPPAGARDEPFGIRSLFITETMESESLLTPRSLRSWWIQVMSSTTLQDWRRTGLAPRCILRGLPSAPTPPELARFRLALSLHTGQIAWPGTPATALGEPHLSSNRLGGRSQSDRCIRIAPINGGGHELFSFSIHQPTMDIENGCPLNRSSARYGWHTSSESLTSATGSIHR